MVILLVFTFCLHRYGGKQASYEITTEEEFELLADDYNIFMVDFHAPWCSHCRKFSPTWETFAYYFNDALHLMEEVYVGLSTLSTLYSLSTFPLSFRSETLKDQRKRDRSSPKMKKCNRIELTKKN